MKIILMGYGKMGKAIEKAAMQQGHEVIHKINAANQHSVTIKDLQQAEAIIEFTNPDSAVRNIKMAIDAGVPIISGTTGWLSDMPAIQNYCKEQKGTFLYASNFSIGVNLFFKLNKQLASMMNQHKNYTPSLTEIHHTQKLDAPSGTGITLANDLIEAVDRKTKWVKASSSKVNEVPIVSKRIDKVPGTHAIEWTSDIDTIEIKHTAHSRDGFVQGALLAAKWIQGKQGVFGMDDVLGF